MSYGDEYIPIGDEDLKNVPQSQEAEQAVLGALLANNLEVYPEIRDLVQPKHFYNPIHVDICNVIYNRSRRAALADAIYLKNRYARDERLLDIGGVEYLALLLDNCPPLSTAPDYARLVVEMAGRRECIRFAQDILKASRDRDSDDMAADIISNARKELSAIEGVLPSDTSFITLKEASYNSISVIGLERPMGLPSSYAALDAKLSGFGRGKLSVVAGRPSMGKTSLATNIARNIAKGIPSLDDESLPGKVGFFTQEMPALELGERAASAAAGKTFGITYNKIAKHDVGPARRAKLLAATENIPEGIILDESSGLTHSQIAKRSRAMEKQLGGLDMIVVDYLNLMSGKDCEDPRNDVKYYAEICRELKALAKKMDIHVMLLAQLSRKTDEREGRRPQIQDLKGSSGIEDAADIVLLLTRKEKVLIDSGEPSNAEKKKTYYQDIADSKNKMEVIVAKNKGGPLGSTMLNCFLPYDIITELSDEDGQGFDEDLPF